VCPCFSKISWDRRADSIAGAVLYNQSVADRAARKSVPFQVAAKLAGGVQSVQITVYVNQ